MPGNRRSIRLKDYDYRQQGAYFVTVCVNNRRCLFGNVGNGEIALNKYGKIADKCWNQIPQHFPHTELDQYIIMPNHIHGIINIIHNVGAKDFSPLQLKRPRGTSKTIGSIIRGFKTGVIKWFRKNTNIKNVWQRNYYEHVIRDESGLARIREYIINNPANWEEDEYYT